MPKKKTTEIEISDRESAFNALRLSMKDISDELHFEPVSPEDVLQLPSPSINLLCGDDKGIRKGSIVHCYGPRGSLKTTIALIACREAQLKWPDKSVAYIDTEYRVDLYLASKLLQVNLEPFDTGVPRFVYRRPETAEQAWEEIAAIASTGHFSLIVLDSATTMRSKSVVESTDFAIGQVGNAARINSAALNKYAPLFPTTGTILWAINQERITSIQPIVTKGPTGGAAWGFYTTHEFKIESVQRKREQEEQKITVVSNKMKWAVCPKEVEVPIILGHGPDEYQDIINCAIRADLIKQSGSWVYIGEHKVQGVENAGKYIKEHPEVKTELLEAIYQLG